MLDISHENCLWFKFKDSKIIFGIVYIPPEGSFYGSLETFDVNESNIIEINSQFDNSSFVMLGDFNARTSNLSDFVNVDPFISDIALDNLANQNLSVNNLSDLGFPFERFSEDLNFVNNYGHRLLDMCGATGLFVANGRCGNDLYIGKSTCKGASLIDYVLMSPCHFPYVNDFVVQDFDPVLSDVHCCISFKFSVSYDAAPQDQDDENNINDNEDVTVKPIWDNSVRDQFASCFKQDVIDQLKFDLDKISNEKNFSKDIIDNITERVSKVMSEAADSCNLFVAKKNNAKKYNKKSLFINTGLTVNVKLLGSNIIMLRTIIEGIVHRIVTVLW